MRKYKSEGPMVGRYQSHSSNQMASSTSRGILQRLAFLAIVLVLPGRLFAQAPGPQAPGLLAAANTPGLAAALPSSPDTSTPSTARPPITTAAMFPIRAIEVQAPPQEPSAHPFWDRENRTLFAASTVWAVADFFVTRSNLSSGGRELNPVARMFTGSTPALAANFALETGGVVGISYFFHQTGHHKLERMTSYVNISASVAAVGFGLAHH
jgi:hypothetical protein